MQTPQIVSPEEWEAARLRLLVKEKELTKARDAMAADRRRMPWMAVDKDYEFEGPSGNASLPRPVRGPPAVDRVPRLLRTRRARLARPRVRRLLDGRRPGRPRRPSECPRHHPRLRLPRPAGRHRAGQGPDGLGDAVVHDDRRLRRRLRCRRVARDERVHPRRRPGVPHLLHQQPGRRGAREHVELPRHDRPRPSGGVGGLPGGLPAGTARTRGGSGTTRRRRPASDRPGLVQLRIAESTNRRESS